MPQRFMEQSGTRLRFITDVVSNEVHFAVMVEALCITRHLVTKRFRNIFDGLNDVDLRRILPISRCLISGVGHVLSKHACTGATLEPQIPTGQPDITFTPNAARFRPICITLP